MSSTATLFVQAIHLSPIQLNSVYIRTNQSNGLYFIMSSRVRRKEKSVVLSNQLIDFLLELMMP